jgi:mannose-6-phosphate isomerase-like protein (cupin superfamily)
MSSTGTGAVTRRSVTGTPAVWRLPTASLTSAVAHHGTGTVDAVRLATGDDLESCTHFLDYVEIPARAAIGRHQHAECEEEYYLVLLGKGLMHLDGDDFEVRTGDLIRNRPGGTHGLVNTGSGTLAVFVFEVEAESRGGHR